MTTYRADWVLPMTGEPLRGAAVAVADGRITDLMRTPPADAVDLGRVAVLPGLVNAHTHLELSYLDRRVPPGAPFVEWIRTLMAERRRHPDPAEPEILDAARRAIRDAHASGTVLFGDISNTLVTVPLLEQAGVAARVFYELLGFTAADAGDRVLQARLRLAALGIESPDVRVSLAPHAPYSVAPALFGALRADLDAARHAVSSVHLGESAEEVEFLRHGGGAFRELLESLGVWNESWRPPGVSPVDYLADLGFLDARVLVVHGVQFDGDDLTRLAGMGVTLVSCPRSNLHVGVGSPPLEAFYAMDVDVALGTDSLASVADLNMFAELAEARRVAPRVPARRLLESATLVGARALGYEHDFGAIERGRRAALLAVRVPAGVTDVEEYLLSGIEPAAVTWLAAEPAAPPAPAAPGRQE
jgi:cytosine/adenosine deaminase-related metal-dependent hydrolase